MKAVKILHTADIHIGAAESFLGAAADNRRFETLITFEKIMDIAVEKGIELIALAGDLFDSNDIDQSFVKAVFAKISAAAPIKVVFAAGNHDPLNANSPFLNYDLPENLYVLGISDECITFEELKVRVYGRSFERASLRGEELFTLKTDDEYINILVQHGELKSDLNSQYNAITPKFVKNSGMDYIALGHQHKRTEIGRIDGTYFAYCGCPEGQGFDELMEKGIYIGEVGKQSCRLEFLPVSKRQHAHERIDISGLRETGEIFERIISYLKERFGEGFRDNLYKIELVGQIDEDTVISLAELKTRLADELYFAKLKDSTEYKLDLESLSNEISLKGIFVKKLLESGEKAAEEEKELYKKALSLGLRAFVTEVKYDED